MAQTSQPAQADIRAANTPAAKTDNRGLVTYDVNGNTVKLSYQIVRDYLTKGNGQVTDQELMNFIMISKYNRLNPFLNEAYLVKFQGSPAQMIVSKEALFKRAEECPEYEGIESGIIVMRGEQVIELEGCFKLATDILLGGWAKVYRKDRRFPIVAKVNLTEYDKGQSIWKDKKNTMIAKVAKVAALREAFPQKLGGMYAGEEVGMGIPAQQPQPQQSQAAAATAEYARRAAEMSRRPATAQTAASAPVVEEAEIIADSETGEVATAPEAPVPASPTSDAPSAPEAAPAAASPSPRSQAARRQAAEAAERLAAKGVKASELFDI